MDATTEQIARQHRAAEVLSPLSDRDGRHLYVGCACGLGPISALSHAAHVAEMAAAAVHMEHTLVSAEALRDTAAAVPVDLWCTYGMASRAVVEGFQEWLRERADRLAHPGTREDQP